MDSIDDLFKFYREEFLPAYSDLVGYIADKPTLLLTQIESTFTHIAQYFNPQLNESLKSENLHKAKTHLIRVTLDCYKLLWASMHSDLKKIEKDKYKRKFALNISESEFLSKFLEFKKLAKKARRVEMESIGVDPLASLEYYKKAIEIGNELLESVDHHKLQELESLSKNIKTIITAREFLIGVLTGIISTLIVNQIFI